MALFRHAKIRNKLSIVYLGLIALSLITIGLLSYSKASSALSKQASQQLVSLAHKSVEQIDAFLDTCVWNVRELSMLPRTRMAFYLKMYTASLSSIIIEFQDYIRARPYINRIRIANLDGEIVLDTPEEQYFDSSGAREARTVTTEHWFQGALNSEDVYVTDMYRCEDTPWILH